MPTPYATRFHDPAAAAAYRDKFRTRWTRRLSQRAELRALEAALAAAGPAATGLVLDVPCGAGRMAGALGRRAAGYLGLDLSLAMARLCREETGRPTGQASAWALPLAPASVDLAACLRLSHHVPLEAERRALLAELCRVAKDAVLVSFLDRRAPRQVLHRLRRRLQGRPVVRPAWSAAELAAAAPGFRLAGTFARSGWFSGQTIALLLREAP